MRIKHISDFRNLLQQKRNILHLWTCWVKYIIKINLYLLFSMAPRKFKITYVACICSLNYISIAILSPYSDILPENKGKENRRENWLSQSLKDSFFNDKSVLILFIISVEINSIKKSLSIYYL